MTETENTSIEKTQKYLRRLHAPDEAVRVHAALRLTGLGIDRTVLRQALEQALNDPNPHVQRLACWILTELKEKSVA